MQELKPEYTIFEQAYHLTLKMAFAGAILGAVIGLVLERLIQSSDGSGITYGQQYGLFMLPTCALLGAGFGLGLFLARLRRLILAAGVQLLVGLLACRFTWSSWSEQRQMYGYDQSEIVLYYPALMLCAIIWLSAIVLLSGHFWLMMKDWWLPNRATNQDSQ